MIFKPQIPEITKHIDHYWILNTPSLLTLGSSTMFAYPGITPDMIIVLEGHYKMIYRGKIYDSDQSRLFSFLHEPIYIDLSGLKKCIIVKFKSRGLSALRPFVKASPQMMMQDSVALAIDVFGEGFQMFLQYLKMLPIQSVPIAIDEWLFAFYKKEQEGFVIEMAQEVSSTFDIQTIMQATGYSYSTIERYFKTDAGLTPKRFQSLWRYKLALRELFVTRNPDWQHYVVTYGYYDQSHFIREIKKYTGKTPTQLLQTVAFVEVRPI